MCEDAHRFDPDTLGEYVAEKSWHYKNLEQHSLKRTTTNRHVIKPPPPPAAGRGVFDSSFSAFDCDFHICANNSCGKLLWIYLLLKLHEKRHSLSECLTYDFYTVL